MAELKYCRKQNNTNTAISNEPILQIVVIILNFISNEFSHIKKRINKPDCVLSYQI